MGISKLNWSYSIECKLSGINRMETRDTSSTVCSDTPPNFDIFNQLVATKVYEKQHDVRIILHNRRSGYTARPHYLFRYALYQPIDLLRLLLHVHYVSCLMQHAATKISLSYFLFSFLSHAWKEGSNNSSSREKVETPRD